MRDDDIGIPSVPSDSAIDDDATCELCAQVAGLLAGEGDPEALLNALRRSRLYCVRLGSVGFAAIGPPGAGFVPVFTSEEQLALFAGKSDWFSTDGADVLRLLPPGYDLALDLAGPQPVRLHAAMWEQQEEVPQHG